MIRFYRSYDTMPKAARRVIQESVWLGARSDSQLRTIPAGKDLVARLRRADEAMLMGSNLERYPTDEQLARAASILRGETA